MEFKCRAWDVDAKKMNEWVDVILSKKDGDTFYVEGFKVDKFVTEFNHEIILLWYTGLKDRYGTEIYKGDIMWDDHYEEYGEVKFDEAKFIWNGISSSGCSDLFEVHDQFEVVGNIYQNKELL